MPNGPVTWDAVGDLRERIARLEEHVSDIKASTGARRNRTWLIVMGVLTGLVCPVVVTSLITLLHLANQ